MMKAMVIDSVFAGTMTEKLAHDVRGRLAVAAMFHTLSLPMIRDFYRLGPLQAQATTSRRRQRPSEWMRGA